MDAIYLDQNANAPQLPAVADAVREASLRYAGNPASQHEAGRQARRALEAARRRVGELLGARPDDRVIFTSGGTESNNLAISGLAAASANDDAHSQPDVAQSPSAGPRVLVSGLEHPSVGRAAQRLATHGWGVDELPATAEGVVRTDLLEDLLRPETRLVSVTLACGETGVLQPVAQIASACRTRGASMHTDATQMVGKLPVDFSALGVDALTCAAHKFHGPLGIGALVVRAAARLHPQMDGGFQQGGFRPGTETTALAIGMTAALDAWAAEADDRRRRMTALRDSLERQILAGDSDCRVIGAGAPRLPQTTNLALIGLDRQAVVMALDLVGVACSTGTACASGSSEPSAALVAMGLPSELIRSSVRLSLGATTTAAEIDEAASRILSVIKRLRRQ